jgi:pimeloyl-ACP methyl ester carboxylesterase
METVQSADGTTIAFDRCGDGPPLILVLGAFCDRSTARTLADLLAPHFSVYAYDRRGRGASGDKAPYAVEREIEDLAAVVAVSGGPAHVFGHSSGAVLALEAAARSLPIAKLAVYEPPYIVDDSRHRPVGLENRVRQLIAAGHRSEAIEVFLIEGPEVPPDAVAIMKDSPGWPAMEKIAPTLPYDLAVCGDQALPVDRLAKIQAPTLALSGGDSPVWARNSVDAVAATIPNARQLTLVGQTHGVADDVLAPVLVDFFKNR